MSLSPRLNARMSDIALSMVDDYSDSSTDATPDGSNKQLGIFTLI